MRVVNKIRKGKSLINMYKDNGWSVGIKKILN